jgi:hypothetical protein
VSWLLVVSCGLVSTLTSVKGRQSGLSQRRDISLAGPERMVRVISFVLNLIVIPVGGGQFIILDGTVSRKHSIIEVAPIDDVRIPTSSANTASDIIYRLQFDLHHKLQSPILIQRMELF